MAVALTFEACAEMAFPLSTATSDENNDLLKQRQHGFRLRSE
jgi:hypothetical protein